MTISIRLPSKEEVLLERAVGALCVNQLGFVRAENMFPGEQTLAHIDARYIGKGGGLRKPTSVANPQRRAILERLHEKHGSGGH
jgi:hypothetical protein